MDEHIKSGHWILHKNGSATCSECHFTFKGVWDMDNWDNYCRHCGADNRNGAVSDPLPKGISLLWV